MPLKEIKIKLISKPVSLPYPLTVFPQRCHKQIEISTADSWGMKHVTYQVFQYAIDLDTTISIGRNPSRS
jgi:hypothetical protein